MMERYNSKQQSNEVSERNKLGAVFGTDGYIPHC